MTWPEEAAYWTDDADGDPVFPVRGQQFAPGATIPARPASPPPSPPPASGMPAIEGTVLTGEVSGGVGITVNAKEGITVGPDEVLVIVVDHMDPVEYAACRAEIETALPRNRYLIFVGAWKLAKVHSVEVGPDGSLRPLSQPHERPAVEG